MNGIQLYDYKEHHYIQDLEAEILRQRLEIMSLKNEVEELRHYADKFSRIFYDNQSMMFITRLIDGVFIDVNNNYADFLGYKREEMLGKTAIELGVYAVPEERQLMLDQLAQNGYLRNFEAKYRRKCGETGTTVSTISVLDINGEKCLLVSSIDISERKSLEDDLLISNEKFSKAFYGNQAMLSISRLEDGLCIDVNDACKEIMGYSREELIGRSVFEVNVYEEPDIRQDMIQELLKDGHIRNFENKFVKKSGEIGYSLSSSSLFEMSGEKYLLTSVVDISKRIKAEESLRLSQELFCKIFHSCPLSIIIITVKDKKVVEVNDTFLIRNQVNREDFLGKTDDHLDFWKYPDELDIYFDAIRQNGIVKNYEVRFYLPTGEVQTVLLSGAAINWQGEDCVLSINNDITELTKYQENISKLEYTNIMGQMAASIAHEIRNPMTSIRGFLQLFGYQDKYREDKEAMDLMIDELDRMNGIISNFLSLSPNNNHDFKPRNLNGIIKDLLPLLAAEAAKYQVSIETILLDISDVVLDEGNIKQLLLNLVRNGLEAMGGRGTLTIKTFEDSNGISLHVQDRGSGIPSEIVDKIGTPFFTTKGNRTGLGLTVCYSIAERHKAKIHIDTGTEGTVFKVIFPMAGYN